MQSEISILITGDFCPINRVESLALNKKYEAVFNDFQSVFEENDLNVTDMECPLSMSSYRMKKTGPHQYAHPDCINLLSFAKIDLVAMANNHILDLGEEGVEDTLKLCKNSNIETVGIGRNQEEARAYFVKEIKGKKIAILNFSDNEFLSTPQSEVQANPVFPIHNFYDIQQAKSECDFVILVAHAGNEFFHLPSPRTKELYRFFVDVGVDAVIAHHTHCFSGYEVYKEKPIFYGLGNFVYDNPEKKNGDWNEGYVVKLLLTDRVNFEIIPLKQGNETPGVFRLSKIESSAFNEKIENLSQIIADDIRLENEFQAYCKSVENMYDAFIEPYWGKYIHKLKSLGLFPRLLNNRKRLLYLNLIRCDSHRDVLLRMLDKYRK
ncbi:MAG: CapA family protein [Bacteroidales bacterium]|nr:CapA family protein [Bacteroidales bacterium]